MFVWVKSDTWFPNGFIYSILHASRISNPLVECAYFIFKPSIILCHILSLKMLSIAISDYGGGGFDNTTNMFASPMQNETKVSCFIPICICHGANLSLIILLYCLVSFKFYLWTKTSLINYKLSFYVPIYLFYAISFYFSLVFKTKMHCTSYNQTNIREFWGWFKN